MDLGKMKNEDKLTLCRWYFRAGFFCLPFVWSVNALWFFKEAFVKPTYEEQGDIKKYVVYSALGAIVWWIAIVSWVVTYQTFRASWGEFGDAISAVLPTGVP